MRKIKKLFALILAFVLILGITGINVYAESIKDSSKGITTTIDLTKEGTQIINTVDEDGKLNECYSTNS